MLTRDDRMSLKRCKPRESLSISIVSKLTESQKPSTGSTFDGTVFVQNEEERNAARRLRLADRSRS